MLMGAHVARLLVRTQFTSFYGFLFILILSFPIMSYADEDVDVDVDILLRFKNGLTNNAALKNWDPSTTPCDGDNPKWVGILCYSGFIWGLKLEGMKLKGLIDIEALTSLHYLRTMSVMNNEFEGPIPEIRKLGALKSIYLSNNRFSGEIPPDAFLGMGNLKKVLMSNNEFTGKIPWSLTSLPRLLELRLDDNKFEGPIPDFKQSDIRLVSFANNNLEGPIPLSLNMMGVASFQGNDGLCGQPMKPCPLSLLSSPSPSPSPSDTKSFHDFVALLKRNISYLKIIIIVLSIGLLLVLLALLFSICQRRKRNQIDSDLFASESGRLPPPYVVSEPELIRPVQIGVNTRRTTDPSKLTFLNPDIQKFDLQDLLKSSAEVLGSGNFGASYKTTISSGQAMVVKRYKLMNNVGREDFHEHMRRLGRLKHPNVLPVIAYYYRKEEKLLVTQFMEQSSLASHLHVNHSADQPGLPWVTRLKIIKGVASGLAYLYTELPTLIIPHGHLKSSNVVLDSSFQPLLTDYALRPMMNATRAHTLLIAYKSPEYAKTGHITKKSDVWCLGVLILELLTGKFPENYLTQGYNDNASLAKWVSNMIQDKQMGEVFDKEMIGTKNSKSEMLTLLKIGLSCCEEDGNERLDLNDAVEQISRLNEEDVDEEYSPSLSQGSSTDNYLLNR